MKREARRPPNSGRSAPSVVGLRAGLPRHTLPAHHPPVELPSRNRQPIRKSVQFSTPKSVKFSTPIDTSAARTSSVRMCVAIAQPTTRRLQASSATARYSVRVAVGT